jgi:thioredoxin-like negative regulator of GroEL
MVYSTQLAALVASLAVSYQLSSSTNTALAFTPSSPLNSKTTGIVTFGGNTKLFYQAGTAGQDTTTATQNAATISTSAIETIAHINDSTHESILHNSRGNPVLVDCYAIKCGPCKLIERSIQATLPKYASNLLFSKWDIEEKENSLQFMNLLRDHEMTFRKLPTLILFVDGVPVALRSGMASAEQIDKFLADHLPNNDDYVEECVDEITLDGEKFLCAK